jgi:hypothetical protein
LRISHNTARSALWAARMLSSCCSRGRLSAVRSAGISPAGTTRDGDLRRRAAPSRRAVTTVKRYDHPNRSIRMLCPIRSKRMMARSPTMARWRRNGRLRCLQQGVD